MSQWLVWNTNKITNLPSSNTSIRMILRPKLRKIMNQHQNLIKFRSKMPMYWLKNVKTIYPQRAQSIELNTSITTHPIMNLYLKKATMTISPSHISCNNMRIIYKKQAKITEAEMISVIATFIPAMRSLIMTSFMTKISVALKMHVILMESVKARLLAKFSFPIC